MDLTKKEANQTQKLGGEHNKETARVVPELETKLVVAKGHLIQRQEA